MATDEQTRLRVFARLREALGEEVASTLMSAVPPFAWSDVATKADLAALGDKLRGELHTGMAQLRGEMGELRGEMHTGMGELRGEMGALEARMTTAMATQARYYTATMVGAVLTTGALAFAAAGLT
ncbi:MAG: hypothetical protein WD080_13240 [Egibacteraceae bacterium]